MILIGKKLYERCATCKGIVRVNKPIIGDLHICLSDTEILMRRRTDPPPQRIRWTEIRDPEK